MPAKKKTAASTPRKQAARSPSRKKAGSPETASQAPPSPAPVEIPRPRHEDEDDLPLEELRPLSEEPPPAPSMNLTARRANRSERLPLIPMKRATPPVAAAASAEPIAPMPAAADLPRIAEVPAPAAVPPVTGAEEPGATVESLTATADAGPEPVAEPPAVVAELSSEPAAPEPATTTGEPVTPAETPVVVTEQAAPVIEAAVPAIEEEAPARIVEHSKQTAEADPVVEESSRAVAEKPARPASDPAPAIAAAAALSVVPAPAGKPSGETEPPEPASVIIHGEFALSRRAAWIGIACFLALLVLPPLWNELNLVFTKPDRLPAARFYTALRGSERPETPVAARLRGFESELARSGFTNAPRSAAQQTLLTLLDRGNSKVVPGLDDGSGKRWLFLRSEIEALTGWGPLQEEPHSVIRDPDLKSWQAPLPVILDFAQKLRDRGVRLMLVPVPMKAAIFPEKLIAGNTSAPLRHPDEAEFYRRLNEAGIKVIDMADEFAAAKTRPASENTEPIYLRTDTHWSSWAMQHTANRIAMEIAAEAGAQGWGGLPASPGGNARFEISAPTFGDLVQMLGVSDPWAHFERHRASLAIPAGPDGKPPVTDRSSPVLVIGDSNVNIFDDPSLGFVPESHTEGARTEGGFAQHLASQLSSLLDVRGVDVHAINGQGTSGVRDEFFRRGESAVRSKKVVVWVLAARNLLMDRTTAAEEGMEWRTAEVQPDPAPAAAFSGKAVIEAEVIEKSELADPVTANYADSLYAVHYRLKRTISGPAPAPDNAEITVVQWNFRKREPQPARSVEVGKTYRLALDAWPQPQLEALNLEDNFDSLQRWWAESVEAVP